MQMAQNPLKQIITTVGGKGHETDIEEQGEIPVNHTRNMQELPMYLNPFWFFLPVSTLRGAIYRDSYHLTY